MGEIWGDLYLSSTLNIYILYNAEYVKLGTVWNTDEKYHWIKFGIDLEFFEEIMGENVLTGEVNRLSVNGE